MVDLSREDIQLIIDKVITKVSKELSIDVSNKNFYKNEKALSSSKIDQFGVYDDVVEAVEKANEAHISLVSNYSLNERTKLVDSIRENVIKNINYLADLTFSETKIGRLEDKKQKIYLAATKTPGPEDLQVDAQSGDYGITVESRSPFGVIGAITPVTNPVETILNNAISMISAGNSVVFNVHPSSVQCSREMISLINKSIVDVGGPNNLCTMVANPSIETLEEIISSKQVKLLVGTGGSGLVNKILKSGKKAIGAGAGNPPVIVDYSADLQHAAKSIVMGASFDNNLLCIAEKTILVDTKIYDNFIYYLLENYVYILNNEEKNKLLKIVMTTSEENSAKGCTIREGNKIDYRINKKWIGQNASDILKQIGVYKDDVKLIVYETDKYDPFVYLEQMMPLVPMIKYESFEDAVDLAVKVEGGNKHTASIFSKNIEHIRLFEKKIQTTIFVNNEATLAGVGFKGEGCTTFTIAGPTGEGITSARTFTRKTRSVVAKGGE